MTGLYFILDENVIRAALSCTQMANNLIFNISKSEHSLALNHELYNAYWRNLKRYNDSIHHPFLQPVIGQILRDHQKCKYLPGPFVDPSSIAVHHRKDVFLAQIAFSLSSTCFIVTMDNKTRSDLNKLALNAISLSEAMKLFS